MRYHLGNIPAIDPAAYRLRVGRLVSKPLELSLADPEAAIRRRSNWWR